MISPFVLRNSFKKLARDISTQRCRACLKSKVRWCGLYVAGSRAKKAVTSQEQNMFLMLGGKNRTNPGHQRYLFVDKQTYIFLAKGMNEEYTTVHMEIWKSN